MGVLADLKRRALMPVDTWERHRAVAQLAGRSAEVLDVGGVAGELVDFLPGARITVANVKPPADVLLAADGALPFPERSFELVTSLDVLEHVPPSERRRFAAELGRVSADRIIACCPLGTPEHVALQAYFTSLAGHGHPFLEEHLTNGLPTLPELQDLFGCLPGYAVQLLFHGDCREVDRGFRLAVRARFQRDPRALLAFARVHLRSRAEPRLSPNPHAYTNRVFIEARRGA
jgi:Methyltransferase domain